MINSLRVSGVREIVMKNTLIICAIIILCSLLFFACKIKQDSIRADAVTRIAEVKQTKQLGELIKLASPAYQQAAIQAGDDLGLTANVLLSNSKFPVSLKDAPAPPEPDELEIMSRGRFALVSFTDDNGKVYTFKLVQDRGQWFFFLETPLEARKYGEFRVN